MTLQGKTIQHSDLHTGPSRESETLFVLDRGVALELLGPENDYWHLRLTDGRKGYVHTALSASKGQCA